MPIRKPVKRVKSVLVEPTAPTGTVESATPLPTMITSEILNSTCKDLRSHQRQTEQDYALKQGTFRKSCRRFMFLRKFFHLQFPDLLCLECIFGESAT